MTEMCFVFVCFIVHCVSMLCSSHSIKVTFFSSLGIFKDISGYSDVLQETLIPIIPEEKCRSPEIYGTEITENMFCAGYFDSRSDACQVM